MTDIIHVERADGVCVVSVQTSVGEAEPCPEVYGSVTGRVAESFEPGA